MSANAAPDHAIPSPVELEPEGRVELFFLLRAAGDPRPALESAFRARGGGLVWSARVERLLIGEGELHWTHAALAHGPSRRVLLEATRHCARAAGLEETAVHRFLREALPGPARAFLRGLRFASRWIHPAEPDPKALEAPKGMEPSPLNPPLARLRELAADRSPAPAFMINLLAFRERAAGADPARGGPISGRAAYRRYGLVAARSVALLGGSLEHLGRLEGPIADRAGLATSGAWDELAIVRYPRPRSLVQLERMPGYARALAQRNAGLARTALLVAR